MYFTSGSDRAFEQLMQTRPGADHFDSGEAGAPEDCGTCRFYRPHWKYQFCVYEECPYQPGKLTALDGAVKFQVKGVDDEMAVFRVEKNRGYTVMSNHHLRNKDLSLKAKGLLSQMLSLPEDWDFTLKGLSLINREQIDAIRAAVRELEQAGYIVRSRERDSQGRLRGADYIIYEQPQPVPDSPTLERTHRSYFKPSVWLSANVRAAGKASMRAKRTTTAETEAASLSCGRMTDFLRNGARRSPRKSPPRSLKTERQR